MIIIFKKKNAEAILHFRVKNTEAFSVKSLNSFLYMSVKMWPNYNDSSIILNYWVYRVHRLYVKVPFNKMTHLLLCGPLQGQFLHSEQLKVARESVQTTVLQILN